MCRRTCCSTPSNARLRAEGLPPASQLPGAQGNTHTRKVVGRVHAACELRYQLRVGRIVLHVAHAEVRMRVSVHDRLQCATFVRIERTRSSTPIQPSTNNGRTCVSSVSPGRPLLWWTSSQVAKPSAFTYSQNSDGAIGNVGSPPPQ